MESFSGTCANVCDRTDISDNAKIACDAGSLEYCSNATNINSVTCKAYLDRACKTYDGTRTNKPYSNPIRPVNGKTSADYVNTLVNATNVFESIPGNVTSSDITDFMKIYNDSNITSYNNGKWLVDAATYCTNNPNDSKFCGLNLSTNTTNSWFVNYIATKGINVFITTATNKLAETKDPIKIYTDTIYIAQMNKMYPSLFTPIETLFLTNLRESDITNPALAMIRTYSDNLKEGIDMFVLNLILTKKETLESKPIAMLDSEDAMDKILINANKPKQTVSNDNQLQLDTVVATNVTPIINSVNIQPSAATVNLPPATTTPVTTAPATTTPVTTAPTISFSTSDEIKKDIDDLKSTMLKLEKIFSTMTSAINALPEGKTKVKYQNVLKSTTTNYNGIKTKINKELGKFNNINKLSQNDQTVFKYAILSYEDKLNRIILNLKSQDTMMQNLKITIEPFYNITDRFMVSRKWYSKLFNKVTNRFTSKTEKFSTQVSDLVNKTMLYNPNIRMFISNIIKYRTSQNITNNDPLITLVSAADNSNITTCKTSNPLINTICKSMTTSADTTITKSAQDNIVAYCSNNYFEPNCNTHINNNKNMYNINDVYKSATLYCISDAGKSDKSCNTIPNLGGIDIYLNMVMKNTATFDSSGKLNTLTGQCGPNGTFTVDQCNAICSKYPTLCEADALTKCASEKYRYNATAIDTFENKESFDIMKYNTVLPSMINTFIIIIVFFILLLLIATISCSALHTIFCKEVLINIIKN